MGMLEDHLTEGHRMSARDDCIRALIKAIRDVQDYWCDPGSYTHNRLETPLLVHAEIISALNAPAEEGTKDILQKEWLQVARRERAAELFRANGDLAFLASENADLRAALDFVKAERDHWHGLVPINTRVAFPFVPPEWLGAPSPNTAAPLNPEAMVSFARCSRVWPQASLAIALVSTASRRLPLRLVTMPARARDSPSGGRR